MKYKGSKLKEYVQTHRGMYTKICKEMFKGRKGLDGYYRDGKNIQIDKLTGIMKATGLPIGFFVEFEENEVSGYMPVQPPTPAATELEDRLRHMEEVVVLLNKLVAEKDSVIAAKDSELKLWEARCADLKRQAGFE